LLRDWRIWHDLAAILIRRARNLYADDDIGLDHTAATGTSWEDAMKLPRRKFLHLAAVAAVLPLTSSCCLCRSAITPGRNKNNLRRRGPGDAKELPADDFHGAPPNQCGAHRRRVDMVNSD